MGRRKFLEIGQVAAVGSAAAKFWDQREGEALNNFAEAYNLYVSLRAEGKIDARAVKRLRSRWDTLAKVMDWRGCE